MLPELLSHIFRRDLNSLRRELLAYPDETAIWETPPGIPNSAGNLALHLVGNLRHFIGMELGGSGYVRNREAEFSATGIPREEILKEIDLAIEEVTAALRKLKESDLNQEYPVTIAGVRLQTGDWLLHLMGHLSYHLGQIDYHRRFVTGQSNSTGAQPIPELKTAVKVSE